MKKSGSETEKAKKVPKKAGQKTARSVSKKKPEKGKSPLPVLIIMGLLAIIILLINNFYMKEPHPISKEAVETVTSDDLVRDKETKESSRDAKADEVLYEKQQDKAAPETTREVAKVYFIKIHEQTEKIYLSTVQRKIDKGKRLNEIIEELIRGPSAREKERGYLTAVPTNLRLRGVRMLGRTAELDFDATIEQGATGSILISRIDQIVYTATQFDNVDSVIIKINGKTRSTLGSDGLAISGPLHRR